MRDLIFTAIRQGNHRNASIREATGLRHDALVYHLAKMRKAGIVTSPRRGLWFISSDFAFGRRDKE